MPSPEGSSCVCKQHLNIQDHADSTAQKNLNLKLFTLISHITLFLYLVIDPCSARVLRELCVLPSDHDPRPTRFEDEQRKRSMGVRLRLVME